MHGHLSPPTEHGYYHSLFVSFFCSASCYDCRVSGFLVFKSPSVFGSSIGCHCYLVTVMGRGLLGLVPACLKHGSYFYGVVSFFSLRTECICIKK